MEFGITKEDTEIVIHALDTLHDIQAGSGLEESDDTFRLMLKISAWKKENWV